MNISVEHKIYYKEFGFFRLQTVCRFDLPDLIKYKNFMMVMFSNLLASDYESIQLEKVRCVYFRMHCFNLLCVLAMMTMMKVCFCVCVCVCARV